MNKILLPLTVLGCTLGIAKADIAFLLTEGLGLETSSVLSAAPGSVTTVTSNPSGNDLVYSFSYSNVDLDGGGLANDTLTWDVKWEFFENSTLSGGQITLGTDTAGAVSTGVGWMASDGLWREDTHKFTLDNVSLTADAGYTASFTGFTRLWVTAGTYYYGEGVDTIQDVRAANGSINWDPGLDTVLITDFGGNERNRWLGGDITIIPEPATFGLVAAFGGGLLFVRRFMKS